MEFNVDKGSGVPEAWNEKNRDWMNGEKGKMSGLKRTFGAGFSNGEPSYGTGKTLKPEKKLKRD